MILKKHAQFVHEDGLQPMNLKKRQFTFQNLYGPLSQHEKKENNDDT
jgi:hypothetical protein